MRPLAIDLFCGLGGWAEGFLAEAYDVIGFDNEIQPYPAQRVIQDVLTLHGSQFKDATVIVASPPCQAYSYWAMPWKRAKALPPPDNTLFEACFRIQREASETAGRKIPLVVENVRGAQKWVGRAKWHYGSYYLWGDVPALMPIAGNRVMKHGIAHRPNGATNFHRELNNGRRCFKCGSPVDVDHNSYQCHDCQMLWLLHSGIKNGGDWFSAGEAWRAMSSKSHARKQASAMIAKIPFPLARHIAWAFRGRP